MIQICDALADTKGFCLIEKRLMETGIRLGANEYTRNKWKRYLELVQYLRENVGMLVYKLLTGVVENTFDFTPELSR